MFATAVVPVAVAGVLAPASARAATVSVGHGVFVPAVRGHALPTRNDTASSLNWSGYATTPGSGITGVKSTFTVPTVSPVPPGFAANWTGIGGYTSSDPLTRVAADDPLHLGAARCADGPLCHGRAAPAA